MHTAIKEGLRLRAIQAGEAMPFRAERRVPLNEDSLLWTSVTAPGNPGAILGVLLGGRREEPTLHLCANPGSMVAVAELYAAIADDLKNRMERRDWMQIVVGSRSDAKALASVAEAAGDFGPDKPWERRHDGKPVDARLIARARLLGSYLAQPAIIRAASPHQAALIVLAEEIAEHVATPISDQERAHLGVHLAWLRAGSEAEREREAGIALGRPMDHRPLGDLDERITQTRKDLKEHGQIAPLHDVVTVTLRELRVLQEEAYDILETIPEGRCAEWFKERERSLYEGARRSIVQSRDLLTKNLRERTPLVHTTSFLAAVRRPGARVRRFLRQEHALERDGMKMIRIDPVARAGARVEGEVLVGEVVARTENPGRTASWTIETRTNQPIVALDEGDVVELLDQGIEGRIETIRSDGEATTVVATFKDEPTAGREIVEIAKAIPFVNIGDAIKRRIGRDQAAGADREGGRDPEDDHDEGAIGRTSRYGGPSWTHESETPRSPIRARGATPPTRVTDLLRKYA